MLTCIQNDFQNNDGYSGIFIIEPLDLGQGITLGNAIRRVLLSDISGPAITGVRINNLKHEFKAIEGVREDALEILLNIKEIIFREKYSFDKPIDLFQKAYLKVKGPCIVTANMLKLPFEKLQIVNPNQYICTLTKNLKLYIELDIEKGKGYRLYDHEVVQIGEEFFDPIKSSTLKVDALFMPIKRVNYKVKLINDSKGNLKESLILEIVTNGSITPKRALQESLKALIDLIYPLFLTQNFLDISSQISKNFY
jgi:DNA-directed RNA polymerase subunit alpha